MLLSPTFPQEQNESLSKTSRVSLSISTALMALTGKGMKRIWPSVESQGKVVTRGGKNETVKTKGGPAGPPRVNNIAESVRAEIKRSL
jgi:hypothetical protein